MDKLTVAELLRIHSALFPHAPTLKWWTKYPKSKLVARLEAMADELPEAEVFVAPTAGALIVALLEHRISHEDISIIVRRRFPNSKISMLRVRRMSKMM